jgi:DNA-binding NtrC family response regulator
MSKTLRPLIVDDDRRIAKTLVDILRVKGFQPDSANSGPEALEKIQENHYDCILTDIKMPGMNGVELYREVQNIKPEIPVVFMTAYAADEIIAAGLDEGVIATLTKPLDINLLLQFFSSLSKERTAVIIDDDPEICEMLGEILRLRDFSVVQVTDIPDIDAVLQSNAQVVLLDLNLGHLTGLDVLTKIREHDTDLPVVLITAHRKELSRMIETAFQYNIFACLYKPIHVDELISVLHQLQRQEMARLLKTI